MYFSKKNNTNIDNELSKKSFLSKYRNIILICLIIVIFLVFVVMFFTNKKVDSYLILNGENIITIYQGTDYVEPGYKAYNSKDEDLTTAVLIDSNLNNDVIGEYEITYTLGDITETRIVKVIAKPQEYIFIYLNTVNNNVNVYLKKGETYIEPGYQVFSSTGTNLTNEVTVTGEVDTSKKGTYKLIYSVIDSNNVTVSASRMVIVIDSELSLTLENSEYTNKEVTINASVIDEYFDYMLLPDNTKVTTSTYSYEVSKNGKYTFKAYSKKGSTKESTIEVKNIDKTAPSGSCSGSYENGVSTINISANDNIGIDKYVYNNNEYSGNKITINKKLSTIDIIIYDKANNSIKVSCEIIDNSALDPIKPSSEENIIRQEETDTLKVYITKKNSYYITRIWAYDPHSQLNKYDSPEYGTNLYKPKSLLEMAITEKSLNNKLLVGFNASGFYLRDVYDAASVAKYSNYDRTSVGTLVITNGQVIRNAYDKAYKTWYVVGIDSNNNLRIFTDLSADTTSEIEIKKQWANEVINSGIRNTFTFASPLVIDGVRSDITTSMPSASSKVNRQAICQVNTNNFVLITGNSLNRNDLIDIMLDLNCQTGTNLDGGGSIALLFKSKSVNSIDTIIGNGRNLTEVGYFSE